MPQKGDRTLFAVARPTGDEASRQLEIIAVPAPRPQQPSPTARSVHVALSGESGPPRTRSLAGGARLALVAETSLGGSERELIVVDATGVTEGYRMKLGHDPWAWTRTGHAWLVRATNFNPHPPTTTDCRSMATIVDLETGRSRAVPTPGCTRQIQMVDAAPFAILGGEYRVEVAPDDGGGSPAAPDEDVMAIVNRAYPTVDRLLLDLATGTLTSLPEALDHVYIMGDTVYFADMTRILAIDLSSPTHMRVAVTGLQNVRSLAVEPSSRRIAMGDGSGGILVFDANKGLVTRCH